MCPSVHLRCDSVDTPISNRTVGGLTASCTAGILGRLQVESSISERLHVWRAAGFHAGTTVLCLYTWVDNLFSASDSVGGAISILDDFESALESGWNMRIKVSSRSRMVALGNVTTASCEKWPLVLGHRLQPDGSIRACGSCARSAM